MSFEPGDRVEIRETNHFYGIAYLESAYTAHNPVVERPTSGGRGTVMGVSHNDWSSRRGRLVAVLVDRTGHRFGFYEDELRPLDLIERLGELARDPSRKRRHSR